MGQHDQLMGITTTALLEHWQGHRNLTRRVIEAFPEDKLFNYSVGGMRPFSAFAIEFLGMAVPGITGILTGVWQHDALPKPTTKAAILERWDDATKQLNEMWPQVPAKRFSETDKAFGQWEGTVYSFIWYFIENEIHHRGQGYVYLRSLGIEPPYFFDRS